MLRPPAASVNLGASIDLRTRHALKRVVRTLNVQWARAAEWLTLAIAVGRLQMLSLSAHAVRMEDRCVLCACSVRCSPARSRALRGDRQTSRRHGATPR